MFKLLKIKSNGEISILAYSIVVLVFMIVAAIIGGWPKAGSASSTEATVEAVMQYYERMPEDVYKIPEAELKELVDSESEAIYIVDIRAKEDFEKGHIAGAHNIPFKEIGDSLDQLPEDKTIIVYCYTGQTGGQTTAALNIAGYEAKSLNGGMNNGWLKASYPVVEGGD